MNALTQVSDLTQALANLLWAALPVLLLIIVWRAGIIRPGAEFVFEFLGAKVRVAPSKRIRPPESTDAGDQVLLLAPLDPEDPIPADYVFLNHTSFLRESRQAEFRRRTAVPAPHYDIRVILDSYYRGALDRVERVEYVLHESYPNPIQVRVDPQDRFLLKELANGEYVLIAKVSLAGRRTPLILQRYITLWREGPRLD